MVELTHMQQLELEKAGLDMEDRLHRQHSTHMLIMIPPTKESSMHWKWIWIFFSIEIHYMKPIFLGSSLASPKEVEMISTFWPHHYLNFEKVGDK